METRKLKLKGILATLTENQIKALKIQASLIKDIPEVDGKSPTRQD